MNVEIMGDVGVRDIFYFQVMITSFDGSGMCGSNFQKVPKEIPSEEKAIPRCKLSRDRNKHGSKHF